jgi:hypothetical protein
LVHEVGHQGAALLGLVPSLQLALRAMEVGSDGARWSLFGRWISEVVADLWSVARVGITATVGLMSVLSVPRRYVFRIAADDPHPTPWLRVLISAELGNRLYPHPQWQTLAATWRALYPIHDLPRAIAWRLNTLDALVPEFCSLVVGHRPASLRGASIGEALSDGDRTPAALAAAYRQSGGFAERLARLAPARAVAALGQASASGLVDAKREAQALDTMLTIWALENTRQGLEPPGRALAA